MLTRVFWPFDVVKLGRQNNYLPSVVIGWKNSDTDLVVVTTLPYTDVHKIDQALKRDVLLTGANSPSHIYRLCGQRRLKVLGTLNADLGDFPIKAVLDDTMSYPELEGTTQVILFDLPRPYNMQYFSVSPISLELSESAQTVISEEYESELVKFKVERAELVERVKLHSLNTVCRDPNLENCISQINCSYELGALMRKNAKILFQKGQPAARISFISRAYSQTKSVTLLLGYRILMAAVVVGRVWAEVILRVLEYRVTPTWYALKDVSATAQQIDLRLQQFCFWPVQYLTICKRSKDWSSNTDFNVEYIRFYNSIWLVVNDIILGVALGRLFLDNADLIVFKLGYFIDHILATAFKSNMLWLMDWPGGLKLNNELAAFFGELFLWVIQFWNASLNLFRPYFPLVVKVIGLSGFLGATYSISLICDFISLLTLHVYSFYVASARIYHWQLVVLQSLFHLFRGKKHNVLRNRIDRCNYDLDQLLMGTILFTVLIFLLPTVLVFYLTFAFTRFSIVLNCAVLETCLTFLNHFPIFAILLRFKDYKRLPGGIKLVANRRVRGTVLLQPVPLSFSKMFHQYKILGERLQMHYLSTEVVKRLLTGQFVPIQRSKLYGLLYSMLPEERIQIQPLYQQLKECL